MEAMLHKSNSTTRKWLIASTFLTGLMLAAPAMAQDQTTTNDDQEETKDTTTVVITGSRIKSKEYTSSSPVQVITSEKSSAAGLVSAAEVLQGAPAANGSGQINSTFTGFVVDGGGGINTVSLRGLGATRTLVMLNGRRMPPAGVGGSVGAVDLNTIPSLLISRYEILKDGASSVYGSDAVAGVVNAITRTNYEGFEITALARATEEGGGDAYGFGALWGKGFDKGNIQIAYEGSKQMALRAGHRDLLNCSADFLYDASGNLLDRTNSITGKQQCWNTTVGGIVINDTYFRIPRTGSTAFGVTGWFGAVPFLDRTYAPPHTKERTIISPTERHTLFAQGSYRPDWSLGAELYTELMYTQRKSEQVGMRYIFPYFGPTARQNPFLGAPVPASYFGTGFNVVYPYFVTPYTSGQDVKVSRAVFGAKGDWNNWSYDMFLSHSTNRAEYTQDVWQKDRLFLSVGFNEDTFTPLSSCNVGGPATQVCWNPFNADSLTNGTISAAEKAYLVATDVGKTEYDQTIFEASATGDLMQLPAGPLGTAFGISVRKDRINDVPGAISRASNSWGLASAGISKGEDTLKEAFVEFVVPVVRGQPLFEDFKLNLSGRLSSYDSVGDATTYKAGFNWAVDNRLRLRGTTGTSFRSPALYEMFLNGQSGFLSQRSIDPCINYDRLTEAGDPAVSQTIRNNCAAAGIPGNYAGAGSSALIEWSGSRNLKPEESQATTVGIVLTPPELGFKMAIDFWKIQVDNQITSSGAGVVGACYGLSQPNGFCSLFTRNTTPGPNQFQITYVDASYRNIPSEKTSGIDFTIDYEHEFNFGRLNSTLNATYTADSKTTAYPGDNVIDYNGTVGEPDWVGDLQTQFRKGDWTFTHTLNYVGAATNQGYGDEDGRVANRSGLILNAYNVNSTDDWFTHDVTMRYRAKTWSVVAGVVNVGNEKAPIVSYSDNAYGPSRLGSYAFSSQYGSGYLGRQYYTRITKSF